MAAAAQRRRTGTLIEAALATSFDLLDGGIYYLERLPDDTKLGYFDR